MKYGQYKKIVEREFERPLGKIMRELCKEEKVSAWEGARRLSVPKEMFVYWRHYYRLDQKQIAFDDTVNELSKLKGKYAEEAKAAQLDIPLKYGDETSIRGFSEMIDRKIAYYKLLHFESEGLDPETGLLPFYEFAAHLVSEYRKETAEDDEDQ